MGVPTAILEPEQKVQIFVRDKWLCSWCKRPVILAQAMKYMELELRNAGNEKPLAY
jgi:hypothetical protein